MRHTRLLSITAGAATAFLLLTACSSGATPSAPSAEASSDGTITQEAKDALYQFIVATPTPFITFAGDSAVAAGEEMGLTNVRLSAAGGDPTKQVQLINDAIAAGAGAIILTPLSSESIVPAIERANEAGICTIALYNNFGTTSQSEVFEGSKAFFGWDDTLAAQAIAHEVAEAIGGEGNIVIVNGSPASSGHKLRTNGVKDFLAEEYPDITVLDDQPTDLDPAKARAVMQNFIQKHGDQIDGVISITDTIGLAAADVVASSELAGNVIIGSFGGQQQFVDYIEEGKAFATVPYLPASDGADAIRLAAECVSGDRTPVVAASQESAALAPLKDSSFIITQDTVGLIDPEY